MVPGRPWRGVHLVEREVGKALGHTRSLPLLCMVQAPRPINGNVTQAVVDASRAIDGGPSIHRAEVKQALKRGAVVANAVLGKHGFHLLVRLRRQPLQKLDVGFRMELG